MRTFVSYAREDVNRVTLLRDELRALNCDVWMDQQLAGGQEWWSEILRSIRECELFVFAISRASLDSTACQSETAYAVDLRRSILPVMISRVGTADFPESLQRIQTVTFLGPSADSIRELAKALFGRPKTPPLPERLPEPPAMPKPQGSHPTVGLPRVRRPGRSGITPVAALSALTSDGFRRTRSSRERVLDALKRFHNSDKGIYVGREITDHKRRVAQRAVGVGAHEILAMADRSPYRSSRQCVVFTQFSVLQRRDRVYKVDYQDLRVLSYSVSSGASQLLVAGRPAIDTTELKLINAEVIAEMLDAIKACVRAAPGRGDK